MNIFHTSSMEPEKFLTLTEFTALLKAAKDSRERCILLSLAGAGLRAREMTQIRAEDIDFPKGCLHIQALNSKGKKPRTVVLIPLVTDAFKRQLDDRTKGWLFPRYREEHISSRQSRTFSMGIATRAKLQEVKRKDKAGKDRHRIHLNLLRHSFAIWSLDSGVPVGDLQGQLGHSLWRPQAYTLRPARTTDERRISGRAYLTVSQGSALKHADSTLWIIQLMVVLADGIFSRIFSLGIIAPSYLAL